MRHKEGEADFRHTTPCFCIELTRKLRPEKSGETTRQAALAREWFDTNTITAVTNFFLSVATVVILKR